MLRRRSAATGIRADLDCLPLPVLTVAQHEASDRDPDPVSRAPDSTDRPHEQSAAHERRVVEAGSGPARPTRCCLAWVPRSRVGAEPVTPAVLRELAAAAEDMSERVADVYDRLRQGDRVGARVGFRLVDTTGELAAVAGVLLDAAGDLARVHGVPGGACGVGWGVPGARQHPALQRRGHHLRGRGVWAAVGV